MPFPAARCSAWAGDHSGKRRDPRDARAFAERICGVCTGVHALASVYAIEDAIGIRVPDNANIIRKYHAGYVVVSRSSGPFLSVGAGMDWIILTR